MTGRQFRQRIPRSRGTVPGGIAPWSGLAAERRRPISLEQVATALRPLLSPAEEELEERPVAAVLVPLFEHDGETSVLLIRRSSLLTRDPGDIAFPGGGLERGEAPVQAALREAEEEVALPASSVEVLGRMEMVFPARSGGAIAPYLGILAEPPSGLRPHPFEVEELLVVRLADLAEEGVYWEERWDVPAEKSRVLSFFAHPAALGDDVIWGMTAGVLRQLLSAVLLAAGPAVP
jgi:8-oxo-dGTP pyrophosphatase MutT (NUDIX family)